MFFSLSESPKTGLRTPESIKVHVIPSRGSYCLSCGLLECFDFTYFRR